jgi:hypothetical protein
MAMPAAPSAARAEPGTDHGHAWVMRRLNLIGEAAPAPEHHRQHQRRDTGRDVDDDAAGEIDYTHIGEEAAAPYPVDDGGVDQQHPHDREHDDEGKLNPLHIGADDQGRGDDREGHLEHEEQGFRN